MGNDIFFEVLTPLGCVTRRYWELIVTMKHPVMQTRETAVQNVLQAPDEVRRSRSDPAVFLFYRLEQPERWLCAVVRRLNDDGFLITTYPTDAIEEGQQIWNR